jgi:hypothetical protein
LLRSAQWPDQDAASLEWSGDSRDMLLDLAHDARHGAKLEAVGIGPDVLDD